MLLLFEPLGAHFHGQAHQTGNSAADAIAVLAVAVSELVADGELPSEVLLLFAPLGIRWQAHQNVNSVVAEPVGAVAVSELVAVVELVSEVLVFAPLGIRRQAHQNVIADAAAELVFAVAVSEPSVP